MKPNDAVTTRRVVPHFENEADEAQWWFKNKDLIEQDFIDGFNNGTLRRSSFRDRHPDLAGQTSVLTLDPADAQLARELAASHGEPYEDYARRVMHQALLLEKSA